MCAFLFFVRDQPELLCPALNATLNTFRQMSYMCMNRKLCRRPDTYLASSRTNKTTKSQEEMRSVLAELKCISPFNLLRIVSSFCSFFFAFLGGKILKWGHDAEKIRNAPPTQFHPFGLEHIFHSKATASPSPSILPLKLGLNLLLLCSVFLIFLLLSSTVSTFRSFDRSVKKARLVPPASRG